MTAARRVGRSVAPVEPLRSADQMQSAGLPPTPGPPYDVDESAKRRRRRDWPLAAAAVAVVLLLVPVFVYVFAGRGSNEPSATTPTQPVPQTSAPGTTEPATPPDGRIPLSVLRNATLDIPAWPSDARTRGPSGRVRFSKGQSVTAVGNGIRLRIDNAVYGDVDRDGAQETVVNVTSGAEGGSWQVLAFDRDRSGRIITLGRVVATTGAIKVISSDISVTGGGTVRVKVGDFLTCCGEDATIAQWQTRDYVMRNSRFLQTGGPTAFGLNPRLTELSLTAEDLVLGAPVDGVRHGILRVTVTVLEPVIPDQLVLLLQMPANLQREGSAWTGARVEPTTKPEVVWVYVTVPPPSTAGASRTYPLGMARAADVTVPSSLSVFVSGRAAGDSVLLGEQNGDNNGADVRIRSVG